MPLFEHVNFFDGPSVEAVRVVALEISNVARMIVWRVWLPVAGFLPDRPFEHATDRLHAAVRRFGKASFRSRKTSIASVVILDTGMSRKNFGEPGAIGSSKVVSKMPRRTRFVRALAGGSLCMF